MIKVRPLDLSEHKNTESYHVKSRKILCMRQDGAPDKYDDDPGIFVTNIYNEYANIYCHMVHNLKYSHSETLEIIKRLDRNGHVYRFK